MKIVSIMKSCFVQYKPPPEKYVKATEEIYSFCHEILLFRQFQIDFNVCELQEVALWYRRLFNLSLSGSNFTHMSFLSL